ncbi:uncharacterized protein LOC100907611 [Galendromus occidentalis]|uniref:Uncharacterized protein LOC100907611 n=1 Tax=Galendromus occidentalis TaxID=34638 RepID=A0AAJ7L6P5_9ACAR|nr:uncharacterized protein LOC100907611 [Galendromus occidentalis]
MRSIVIAFLVWQCFSHGIVSQARTETSPPTVRSTHSDVNKIIADANDRKDPVIVAKNGSVSDELRIDPAAGELPVEASQAEVASDPISRENVAKTRSRVRAAPNDQREIDDINEDDVSASSVDSRTVRPCVTSRDCDSSRNERCVDSPAGLVCACGQGYVRDKDGENCEIAAGIDPVAKEYEAAWQEHLRKLRGSGEDRNDRGSRPGPQESYGHMPRKDFVRGLNGEDESDLRRERESWLRAELRRIEEETPQEVGADEPLILGEPLSSSDESERAPGGGDESPLIPEDPQASIEGAVEVPALERPRASESRASRISIPHGVSGSSDGENEPLTLEKAQAPEDGPDGISTPHEVRDSSDRKQEDEKSSSTGARDPTSEPSRVSTPNREAQDLDEDDRSESPRASDSEERRLREMRDTSAPEQRRALTHGRPRDLAVPEPEFVLAPPDANMEFRRKPKSS